MVNVLNKKFGPITEIDSHVLKLFYNILPINGVRSLDIFASKFSNIVKGRIEKINVPELIDNKELKRHILLLNQGEYGKYFEKMQGLHTGW